jgi:hypothetical protein
MIESNTIDPFTASAAVRAANEAKVEEMQSRMRGLASAVKNLQEYDEWNDKTRIPRGLTAAQSATGGINQVGHIGLNPNVYTTNHPYQNLTTTGLNTTTGTSINTGILGSSATDYNMKVAQTGQIDIRGTDADIRINGKSMNKWMEQVEQRLNILTVNPELEKEWDDLRRLGERYRKLEKKCQDKAKMWEALKKLPKVKT